MIMRPRWSLLLVLLLGCWVALIWMLLSAADPPPAGDPDITLFSIPFPLSRTASRHHQTAAVQTWAQLLPSPNILLFLEDQGDCTFYQSISSRVVCLPVRCHSDLSKLPTLDCIFADAFRNARAGVVAFVNADVLLFWDFIQSVQNTWLQTGGKNFVMVGERKDANVSAAQLQADNAKKMEALYVLGKLGTSPHGAWGLDYFVFGRAQPSLPAPFVVGGSKWDNCLLWSILRDGHVMTIRASSSITPLHVGTRNERAPDEDGGSLAEQENRLLARQACGEGWRIGTIDSTESELPCPTCGLRPSQHQRLEYVIERQRHEEDQSLLLLFCNLSGVAAVERWAEAARSCGLRFAVRPLDVEANSALRSHGIPTLVDTAKGQPRFKQGNTNQQTMASLHFVEALLNRNVTVVVLHDSDIRASRVVQWPLPATDFALADAARPGSFAVRPSSSARILWEGMINCCRISLKRGVEAVEAVHSCALRVMRETTPSSVALRLQALAPCK